LIKRAEHAIGHTRTVLVGDLNMSPFEKGIVSAVGLHGVMDRKITLRKTRYVQSEQYPFFYNPMWSLLGDASSTPPGTHYFNNAQHVEFFWYMYDQVLIRPDLLDFFQIADLKILCSDGEISFLTGQGLPHQRVASDHLPILFKLGI
jgi:hypothetical protein